MATAPCFCLNCRTKLKDVQTDLASSKTTHVVCRHCSAKLVIVYGQGKPKVYTESEFKELKRNG